MKINVLEDQIQSVSALREPARRALYLYVASQDEPVSRDHAARAVAISRPLAAFHLDRLVAEGLLDVEYRRLSGRRGPGAGRPSKLYRRSSRQLDLSLPQREYELAARLLTQALSNAASSITLEALHEAALGFGRVLGAEAARRAGPEAGRTALLDIAMQLLAAHGFEPFQDGDVVRLRNCPFHALVQQNRGLVCGMNLALLQGVVHGLGLEGIEARLEPRPGLCCVAFGAPAGME